MCDECTDYRGYLNWMTREELVEEAENWELTPEEIKMGTNDELVEIMVMMNHRAYFTTLVFD